MTFQEYKNPLQSFFYVLIVRLEATFFTSTGQVSTTKPKFTTAATIGAPQSKQAEQTRTQTPEPAPTQQSDPAPILQPDSPRIEQPEVEPASSPRREPSPIREPEEPAPSSAPEPAAIQPPEPVPAQQPDQAPETMSEPSSPAASNATQDPVGTATGAAGGPGGLPSTSSLTNAPGSLIQLPKDADGKPKDPSLQISIKLDIAVEVHITARVHGDIIIGLL